MKSTTKLNENVTCNQQQKNEKKNKLNKDHKLNKHKNVN